MKLESMSESLLFSQTNLPDIFFTEYFSQASSDSIKVYLYLLFLSKYNKDVKINDLSKKLELPLKSIQDSIKYWESEGLLIRKTTGYELANIQEIEQRKLYNPKVTLSPKEIKENSKNQYRAKAIENINNEFFQGVMSPSWYGDINLWFSKYSFDEEVMIALFNYCYERSALHKNYVQTVAEAWSNNNIKTFADLDKYYEKQECIAKISKEISKKLRISRQLSQYELAYVEKWIIDFGYNFNIIEIALKKTTSKTNPSFDYIDKLISSWHEHGFKTVESITKFMEDMKQKNKNVKSFTTTSQYKNYNQRSYDDLSKLYANNQISSSKEVSTVNNTNNK